MEQVIKKKRKQESNRFTISDKVQERAKVWHSQMNDEYNGMLTLKRNDLLNTILENIDLVLPKVLIDKIRDERLTGKEKLKWMYQQYLKAEAEGSELCLDELYKSTSGKPKKSRKPRKIKNKSSYVRPSESAQISQNYDEKVSNNG